MKILLIKGFGENVFICKPGRIKKFTFHNKYLNHD